MDNENIINEIEENVNKLYSSTKNEEIHIINEILTKYIQIENFDLLKALLYKQSSNFSKFYASNALITIITNNYLTIKLNDKIEIYDNLINFIVKLNK